MITMQATSTQTVASPVDDQINNLASLLKVARG
jgi:hypothetical protein